MQKYKVPGAAKTTLERRIKIKDFHFLTSRLIRKLWWTNRSVELNRDPYKYMDHCISTKGKGEEKRLFFIFQQTFQ